MLTSNLEAVSFALSYDALLFIFHVSLLSLASALSAANLANLASLDLWSI